MALIFLVFACLLLLGVILWVLLQKQKPQKDESLLIMQQQIDSLRDQVGKSLSQNSSLLQQQLELVSQNLRSSSGEINQRLDNAAKLYGALSGQLGQLSQANQQIQMAVRDISSLQDILRPPKLRGGMGEVFLERLLQEILPPEHHSFQYRFKSGTIVDAVIRLKDGLVPVDAKFPLENFRRMLEAKTDEERRLMRKEFARNVRKHIDDIHDKYILLEEGTFPFALMYIPAENVYYETIIRADEEDNEKALYAYAIARQVMPVSPNSFYTYLVTLSQGFRGMRVEEKAKEIIQHLNKLRLEMERFTDDFRKVGQHISNAQSRYTEAEKRLARFEDKLLAAGETPSSDSLTTPTLPETLAK